MSYRDLAGPCMRVAIQYCASAYQDPFCQRWRDGRQQVAAIGAAGGRLATNTPERGGVRAALNVPRGALRRSLDIGMSQLEGGELTARPAGSGVQRASSDFVALTPHGTSFDQPVVVEVPFDTESGTHYSYMCDIYNEAPHGRGGSVWANPDESRKKVTSCCSTDDTLCLHRDPGVPWGHSQSCLGRHVTYAEAEQRCAAIGRRLCTQEELESRMCCESEWDSRPPTAGCNYSSYGVWALHEEPPYGREMHLGGNQYIYYTAEQVR
jgi:hypothetical protein